MSNNIAKYHSYREAWSRINDAIEQGFYFEAVTICESIISDRLLSYVSGLDPNSNMTTNTPFFKLLRKWRQLSGSLPVYGDFENLAEAVDAWREERNSVVHGLVKSMPGTSTDSVELFMSRAEKAAIEGKNLAKAVSSWHKKELYHAKKTSQA